MARHLSQTLTRLAPSHSHPHPHPCLRLLTTFPDPLAADEERIAMKKLEDAIHSIIVKRSEPDWLPFVPGSSYWVPPKSKARGVAQVIGKLLNGASAPPMSKDHSFTMTYNRGWPSSAYFVQGAFHSSLEGEAPTKQTSQFEDEEG